MYFSVLCIYTVDFILDICLHFTVKADAFRQFLKTYNPFYN